MYCPVCFNDTLKFASSGVVKLTFNGKAKATSQFFYNMKQEKPSDIYKKIRGAIGEYFTWYATFQNKDLIKTIELVSNDFVCSTGCKLNMTHRLNVIDLIVPKEMLKKIAESEANRHQVPLKLKI